MGKILFINTGGTIDADIYSDPANPPEYATYENPSILAKFVKEGGLGKTVRYVEYSRRDSKNIKPEDIVAIARIIMADPANEVIITHGTDRMPTNSRLLADFLKQPTDKIIVVTGAMIPLHNGISSDGYGNLKFSAEHIGEFEPGVHVVMHRKRFNIIGLSKNFYLKQMENREQFSKKN